jgi:hypothetical protein
MVHSKKSNNRNYDESNHQSDYYSSSSTTFDSSDEDKYYTDEIDKRPNENINNKIEENFLYGSDKVLNNSKNKYELINKIFNGQKDNIDIEPYKILNVSSKSDYAETYPIDQIACGNYLCATSNLKNQINIWSLISRPVLYLNHETESSNINRDLIKALDFNGSESAIWSLCLTSDDNMLFLGQLNGNIKSIELDSNAFSQVDSIHNSIFGTGITAILQIKSKITIPQFNTYILLASRLDGSLDLIRFDHKINLKNSEFQSLSNLKSKFERLIRLQAHTSPIIGMHYSAKCDYVIATSQNASIKLIKINLQSERENLMMSEIHELEKPPNSNDRFLITSMSIHTNEALNELVAAVGDQNGSIFIWNLLNASCVLTLRHKTKKTSMLDMKINKSIIDLKIVDNLLISLSLDHQLCIWNRNTGKLVKEIKFLAPFNLKSNLLGHEFDINENSLVENSNLNVFSAFYFLVSGMFKALRLNTMRKILSWNNKSHDQASTTRFFNNIESGYLEIPPTMCLFSKNILITGGCSSVFLWNLSSGELVKKININKHNQTSIDKYSELNYVKKIQLIEEDAISSNVQKSHQILLVTDFSDSIYVLKIPSF